MRPIGVLWMHDEQGDDAKIICVAVDDPDFGEMQTLEDMNPLRRAEIEHFFTIYKELEGKKTQMQGWGRPMEAREVVVKSRRSYLESRGL